MRRPAFGQPPSPQGEGQESSRPGRDGDDALRALPEHGGEDALRCKRQAKSPALRPGFCLFGILRAALRRFVRDRGISVTIALVVGFTIGPSFRLRLGTPTRAFGELGL